MDPRHLIPEEIWELSLENLEDTDDILNWFYAYPHLTPLLYKKFLPTCLMSVLFPKYLDFEDILNCRLVSKRWKSAVENTLCTHSEQNPDHTIFPTGPYNRLTLTTPFSHQKLSKFKTSRDIISSEETRNEIMMLPKHVNPFIGHSLSMYVGTKRPALTAADELTQILPILEKFGGHVHHAYIKFPCLSESDVRTFPPASYNLLAVLQCMSRLPNLKTLKLKGFLGYCCETSETTAIQPLVTTWGSFGTASTIQIPAKLESLDVADLVGLEYHHLYKLVTTLVSHDHLHKFAVNVLEWDDRFAPLCQHLKELNLKVERLQGTVTLELVQRILQHLGNRTNLMKLSVASRNMSFFRVLQFLKKFPFQSIEVAVEEAPYELCGPQARIEEGGYSRIPLDFSVRSIRHIILDDRVGFTIKLLSGLPNLEYFSVRMGRSTSDSRYSGSKFITNLVDHNAPVPMVADTLHAYFSLLTRFGAVERSIWEVLPNLKMFTVLNCEGAVIRRYVRECKNQVFKC